MHVSYVIIISYYAPFSRVRLGTLSLQCGEVCVFVPVHSLSFAVLNMFCCLFNTFCGIGGVRRQPEHLLPPQHPLGELHSPIVMCDRIWKLLSKLLVTFWLNEVQLKREFGFITAVALRSLVVRKEGRFGTATQRCKSLSFRSVCLTQN